jgi:hypothetical protein
MQNETKPTFSSCTPRSPHGGLYDVARSQSLRDAPRRREENGVKELKIVVASNLRGNIENILKHESLTLGQLFNAASVRC